MAKARKSPARKTRGGKAAGGKKKKIAARKPAARSNIGSGYPIICSECYSDFKMNASVREGNITCPECLHMGSVAESDVMAQVSLAKAQEKSWFTKAIIPGILLAVIGLVHIIMSSSPEGISDGLNYGLLGGSALMLIIAIATACKYETSRYEVYF